MKVLITGATGFIGKHRVSHLSDLGATVIKTGRSYIVNCDNGVNGSSLYKLDIAERDSIKEVVSRHKPERIEHFASLAIVSTSRHDPYAAYRTNVLGVVNVLEAAKACNVPEVMIFTTDKYYGDLAIASEGSRPLVTAGAYETSKLCQDIIAQSYIKQGVNVKIIRSCNVFGPNDMNSRIIPNTLRKLSSNQEPIIFTNILGVRQYIYIYDLMEAIDVILKDGKDNAYNVGTSICKSQKDVVAEIIDVWNETHGSNFKGRNIPGQDMKEIPRQYLRWNAVKQLGWKPAWSFKSGIRDIIGTEGL